MLESLYDRNLPKKESFKVGTEPGLMDILIIGRELDETVVNSNECTCELVLNAVMKRAFVLSIVRTQMGLGLGRRLAESGYQPCLNGVVERQTY